MSPGVRQDSLTDQLLGTGGFFAREKLSAWQNVTRKSAPSPSPSHSVCYQPVNRSAARSSFARRRMSRLELPTWISYCPASAFHFFVVTS